MAFGLSKNREKPYLKTYQDLTQYNKPRCIFSVVPHFDIPRFVLLHSMSTNCSERRSISLGLKNIMIYVITFLIMTGKKCKTSCKYKNRTNIVSIDLSCILTYMNFSLSWYMHENQLKIISCSNPDIMSINDKTLQIKTMALTCV